VETVVESAVEFAGRATGTKTGRPKAADRVKKGA
jgi:hypothetical protein